MKELTIKEKASRYDEAIEKAKSKIKDDKDHVLYEEDITDIFPELKESEGEKIRKGLIAIITDFDSLYLQENYSLSREDALTWLEKQGEQKPAWSEEDEKMWAQVINEIEAIKKNSSTIFEKNIAQDKIDWLKSIKDKVQPQLKREWSEEDIYKIEDALFRTYAVDVAARLLNKIKSIRPQSQWKPSDEQMEALLYEVNAWDEDSINGQNLKSLYQDLKNLREE